MNLIQAIVHCHKKWLDWSGRAGRLEYVWFCLFVFVYSCFAWFIEVVVRELGYRTAVVYECFDFCELIYSDMILRFALWGVYVRRLRDAGFSVGWLLLPIACQCLLIFELVSSFYAPYFILIYLLSWIVPCYLPSRTSATAGAKCAQKRRVPLVVRSLPVLVYAVYVSITYWTPPKAYNRELIEALGIEPIFRETYLGWGGHADGTPKEWIVQIDPPFTLDDSWRKCEEDFSDRHSNGCWSFNVQRTFPKADFRLKGDGRVYYVKDSPAHFCTYYLYPGEANQYYIYKFAP